MLKKTVVIDNKLGLHARAAARFVETAAAFEADIDVRSGGNTINGKSIMGVMMLAASKGSNIQLYAEGEDADSAMEKLKTLVLDRFGEDE